MKIQILPNEAKIIDTVATWLFNEWEHRDKNSSLEKTKADLRTRIDSENIPLTLVALEEDHCVGTASLVWSDLENYEHFRPWLASLYVDPAFRKIGIGSHLCEQIIAIARRLDLQHIYLFTSSQMEYYERMGWEPVESAEFHGRTVVIMRYSMSVSKT